MPNVAKLAGAEIPNTFQGTVFLGDDTEPEPKYHLGFRERADERLDLVRLMRTSRYRITKLLPICPGRASPSLSLEGPIDTRLGAAPPMARQTRLQAASSSLACLKSFMITRLRQCTQFRRPPSSGADRRAESGPAGETARTPGLGAIGKNARATGS